MLRKPRGQTLAFRVPLDHLDAIVEVADKEAGGNVSKAARQIIALGLEALKEREREAQHERVPA